MSRPAGPDGPSTATRFVKGRSGNPKGRPKAAKARTASAFDIVIDKSLSVTQGGAPREVTVEEALQHRTYQDAIAGSRLAQRQILKMIARREQYLTAHQKPTAPKVERVYETEDPDNADDALLILGIADQNSTFERGGFDAVKLLLRPWAVQAALSRRRGGKRLSDEEMTDIKRSTSDPERLRWPRGAKGD